MWELSSDAFKNSTECLRLIPAELHRSNENHISEASSSSEQFDISLFPDESEPQDKTASISTSQAAFGSNNWALYELTVAPHDTPPDDCSLSLERILNETYSLPKISSIPMFQLQCGDSCNFSVVIKGRDFNERVGMHYIRQDHFFSFGINFKDDVHNPNTLFVRITPSWDIQRPDSSTIIYCCDKHMKEKDSPGYFEKFSMLRVSHPNGIYEFDDATGRLSVRIPIANKERSSPYWIPVKSKCFSTCGSTQKKPYHVITVTLESIINKNQKSILGRKIFNVKFSSSPVRDLKKTTSRTSKRAISTFSADLPPVKRASTEDKLQHQACDNAPVADDVCNNSENCVISAKEDPLVINIPIDKRYYGLIMSIVRRLEHKTGSQILYEGGRHNSAVTNHLKDTSGTSPQASTPSSYLSSYPSSSDGGFSVESSPAVMGPEGAMDGLMTDNSSFATMTETPSVGNFSQDLPSRLMGIESCRDNLMKDDWNIPFPMTPEVSLDHLDNDSLYYRSMLRTCPNT